MRRAHPRPRLSLALQGGGAHGAFTWGVLDALLEADACCLMAASGASAGAMNAVVLAQGLMSDGPVGARRALEDFWRAVSDTLPVDPVETDPEAGQARVAPWMRTMLWWSRWLSLHGAQGGGAEPLRRILRDQIDFANLRRYSPIRLFIAATHARTAELRIFREHDLGIDALLASACLPPWHRTVWVDGQPYWDGALAANPPLAPLLRDGGADDVLLVQLLTAVRPALPVDSAEVEARLSELAFITPLLAELRAQRPRRSWWRPWLSLPRWHHIDASAALGALPTDTRLVPGARFTGMLGDLGRARARDWLASHAGDVGRRTSATGLVGIKSR